jgi:hypothetical protein
MAGKPEQSDQTRRIVLKVWIRNIVTSSLIQQRAVETCPSDENTPKILSWSYSCGRTYLMIFPSCEEHPLVDSYDIA